MCNFSKYSSRPESSLSTMSENYQVAVLIACHNRREKTLQCLQSLEAAIPNNWTIRIYLVDDGSDDGTSDAVNKLGLDIKIIQGPGDWFWAHSMYRAELSIDKPTDAILWINDDVKLFQEALMRVERVRQKNLDSILVGQLMDPTTKKRTYGGVNRIGRHPFYFEWILADNTEIQVDTFNGNFVLIPEQISKRVGTIDGAFSHAYADFDYGLRAMKLGYSSIIIAGFLGTCPANYTVMERNLRERLNFLHSAKGLPLKSQVRYLRRHGPIEWPIYLIFPYIRAILGFALIERRRSSSSTNK